MFSFKINGDSIILIFENDTTYLTFIPEEPDSLEGNSFDSFPTNGDFYFNYKDKKICFTCSKYGDGRGGSLDIIIKLTKEEEDSLNKALFEWQNFLKNK